MYLDQDLVGITTSTLGELVSMSKNDSSTSFDEKAIGYVTSTSCWTCYSSYVALISTYFSSSQSLKMTNAGEGGAICLWISLKVSSNASPTMAIGFNASKIYCFMYLLSLELSLP